MTRRISQMLSDQYGASAAEFALVLPVALLFLFAIIDGGRFVWNVNQAEKATQMGARFAIVTEPVPTGLTSYSFVGTAGLTAGAIVPAAAYSKMTCGTLAETAPATCACVIGGTCPWGATAATTAPANPAVTPFDKIYARIKQFYPDTKRVNVKIEYAPSGLGYAGDPTGADINPVVTVRLQGLTFKPVTTQIFNISTSMPDARYSLTMEDGLGAASN